MIFYRYKVDRSLIPGPHRTLEVYKPVLKEVEKILEEAGLDVEEMKKVAGGTGSAAAGASRNRR